MGIAKITPRQLAASVGTRRVGTLNLAAPSSSTWNSTTWDTHLRRLESAAVYIDYARGSTSTMPSRVWLPSR